MSPTTQKFGWKDRDTAARDLLQLVYHAPNHISRYAVYLLQAIRSPAAVPELLDIFRDETRSDWERISALQAVAQTPGDFYLPELKSYLPIGLTNTFRSLIREEALILIRWHPSNQQWFADYQAELFEYFDGLPLDRQVEWIDHFCGVHQKETELLHRLLDRLMALVEMHPEVFNFKALNRLVLEDNRESTRQWLSSRLDAVIALCLIIDANFHTTELVYILEDWGALREALFLAAPRLLPTYEEAKINLDVDRARSEFKVDLTRSAVWQRVFYCHKWAEGGNKQSLKQLQLFADEFDDALEQAAAIHFLGKLSQDPEIFSFILKMVRYAIASVSFEAANALYLHPLPEVWEALVNGFFVNANSAKIDYFIDWIAYQTDRLSGLEVEYTGATLAVEDRPWFRALVERETGKE
ncbi:MAG: hypothetical protein ABI700_24745 [Chloroflexota bacterium]